MPPYSDSDTFGDCNSYGDFLVFASSCQAIATADEATGALGLDLVVTSPAPLGGGGFAFGFAELIATHTVDSPATAVLYTVTLHLDSAEVTQTQPPLIFEGSSYADVYASVSAGHSSCGGCSGYVFQEIVDLREGPTSRSDDDVVFELALANCGGFVPPGQVSIWVDVYGSEYLDGGGEVRTFLDAAVPVITARVEHGAPFGPVACSGG